MITRYNVTTALAAVIGFLALTAAPVCADVVPGETIDKSNWQKVEGLLPDPVLNYVKKGDYIIRGDQPYRTVADIYFAVQRFSTANPSPYDDTGWTFQYLRDIVIQSAADKSLHCSRCGCCP